MKETAKYQFGSVDLQEPYRLGTYLVDPATGRVHNGDRQVKLPPQAINVLSYLASRPGKVVSRVEIEEAVWHGRIIGYDSLTSLMFKLRKALGDDPKKPYVIETISKRGYRLLVEPVPADRPASKPSKPSADADARTLVPLPSIRLLVALAISILSAATVAAALLWFAAPPGKTAQGAARAGRNAIVVLPFESLSRRDAGYSFADGLTDDITTALARDRDLLVIARDSAFVYKNGAVDYRKLASRLRVNFVLRGSVRRNGEKMHVNARLIDAANGNHLWADSFEGKVAEFFDLQNKIVSAVVSVLTDRAPRPAVTRTMLVHTPSTQAYEAFQLGRQHFYLYLNRLENAKARNLFKQALKLDPHFAMARAMLARTYAFDVANGWTENRDRTLQNAADEANRTIAEDPKIALSYFVTGLVFRERREYVKAFVEVEKAIALDPNYANAHVLMATLLYYAGRPAESIERIKKAMRINPHYPYNYYFHLGQAYFTLHRYDEAIKALRRGLASNPAAERLHVWLAASYAHAGMKDDASWEAKEVLTLNPKFSALAIAEAVPFKYIKDRNNFVEGLRKAGLK